MKFDINMDNEFKKMFVTAGQTELTCHCGKRHVAVLQYYDWDEEYKGEIDDIVKSLQKEAETDENLILHYDFDSMELIEFVGGPSFVSECDCKGWKPFMNLMIGQRHVIAKFLIATSKEIKRIQQYEDVMDVLSEEYERS